MALHLSGSKQLKVCLDGILYSVKTAGCPVLAPRATWYKSTTLTNSEITEINIVNRYTPTGKESESWAADVAGRGSIMCYINGTVLTIAGNGSGKIALSADASRTFGGIEVSMDTYTYFNHATNINGLALLDTSRVTNMDGMFWGCEKLQTIQGLSNFNTSKVTNMYRMFLDCKNLASLDLSNFNTCNVIYMSYMFHGCENLTSLDLSNFDTSNTTYMHGMFEGCASLVSLNLSHFNTGKVINMAMMFNGCSSLTFIDLSGFNTSNVYNMYQMFRRCSSLTTLDLSSFNTSKITDMQWMFEKATSLLTIYVDNGWTTANAATFEMFLDCGTDHVTYKNIKATSTNGVLYIEQAPATLNENILEVR